MTRLNFANIVGVERKVKSGLRFIPRDSLHGKKKHFDWIVINYQVFSVVE